MSARGRTARPSARRSRLALLVAAPLSVLMLAGCASVQGAVDGAQQAVDGAQALVEAPQEIANACQAAVNAFAPGTSLTQAQDAIRDATAQLDEALGEAATIPGVSAVRDAFAGAVDSLSSQTSGAANQASRDAVTAACSVFTGN
ncbi:MAG: hypothetical protein IPO93_09875 [Actinobacteria bacterium]|nr:hypothetical protein [Actinomycetota bacterium]